MVSWSPLDRFWTACFLDARSFLQASCNLLESTSIDFNPSSIANIRAPSPTSITWGVFSITRRAAEMGWMIPSIAATLPA